MEIPRAMRLLLCSLVVACAQNLKGSEVAKTDAAEQISLSEHSKLHPPTSGQAIVAFGLILLIPAAGLVIMKRGKDGGWEGAFGMICCLITGLWVYTAVLAFM
ncbi:unnamed protein product [Effrenium voratum]|nr:unnamed protein product [Effrenium voratum]|mmetsp:Transcript_85782/g.205598  ORF Transcript_85782/g.205598 Transcript_85782/m.205598 type:complete len:103 (-) Transcript_85782:35-343(-)